MVSQLFMPASLTAVASPLTGRTVLLPSDDAAAYTKLIETLSNHWSPATGMERMLVQSLIDTEWRLMRIPSLESGIHALGRLEFAELFPSEDESTRKQLIHAKILIAYQRQLKDLSTQEARLRRQRDKDTAALRELQENRKRAEQERLDAAAVEYTAAARENRLEQFDPGRFGFEFSTTDIEVRAREIEANQTNPTSRPQTRVRLSRAA